MKSGEVGEINTQLARIDSSRSADKGAYMGALLMRKAGLVQKPKEKLSCFKSGRIKLETALAQNGANAEYHFLRLMIQEHAPQKVNYHDQLEEDSHFVEKNFKSLSPAVQGVVLDYCKTSGILHTENLKQ